MPDRLLPPAERQDLADEIGGALACRRHLAEVFQHRLVAGGVLRRQLRIAENRAQELLKSWAIPPASVPIASSFCDCRSCVSRARCSVRSLWMAMKCVIRPCASFTGVMV